MESLCKYLKSLEEIKHAPWVDRPFSLVNWWDMQRFSARGFYLIGTGLQAIQLEIVKEVCGNIAVDANRLVMKFNDEFRTKALKCIADVDFFCDSIGLTISAETARELHEDLKTAQWTHTTAIQKFSNLHDIIIKEMKDRMFLYIPSERAQFYGKKESFGSSVAQNFQAASFDIEESGNCFAAARYTACVFHLMRVLEIGLVAFARLYPKVPTDKENWQQIIEKIESEIREFPKQAVKPPDWKQTLEKHSQIANNFMFFKDAWRNYTAHVRGKYTEEEAEDIMRNVRSFMQKLADSGIHE